jgi:CO/xanthine dehydrogenase Mo-binding subunit
MAKRKVLYEGHPVAAVAAISQLIAEQALDLIEVEFEVLPHVMDVEAAMAEDAPLLHDNIFTAGIEPKPEKPSNIAKVVRFAKGDVEAGFEEADVVIERRYTTKPVHQGYIEPHAPSGFGRGRRPDDHLQFEPGSVHGARLYRAHLRR